MLGDEYTGETLQEAVQQVRDLNKPDASGRRVVRIHAIGYMNDPGYPAFTNIRFGALMRTICGRTTARSSRSPNERDEPLSMPARP